MLLRLVAYVIFAASCAKGGAEIRVSTAGMDIDTIELYVGVGNAKSTFLVPESGRKYAPVTAWARDEFNEADKRTVVDDKLTVFQFIDSPDKQLGVVIAVGLKGGVAVAATSIRDVMVPTDKIARYDLMLKPLDPFLLVLERWGAEPTACVALSDRARATIDAVLPPADPDCDGANPECADTFFNGSTPPSLDHVECLEFASSGPSSGACALMGPQCLDGRGWGTGCTTSSVYCVASATCGYCDASAEAYECARDLPPPIGGVLPPHFQCPIKRLMDGTICQEAIPSSPYATSWLLQCNVEEGVRISRAGSLWGEQVSYPTGVTIDVKDLDQNCNFFISPTGHFSSVGDLRMGGMVAAKFTNGRGIAVPILFNLVAANTCGTPLPCTPPAFDPNDAAFNSCVTMPPPPP